MVLFYGLLALETAHSTVAAAATTTTTTIPRIASDQNSLSRKEKYLSTSIGKMPSSSSSSSSNSWIYTEDLRKRFEERYADYRYILVPVYIDRKSARHSHSTTGITPQKIDHENSWMYSRSLRDHLFYSTSKISLPLTTNISSSACCVTNHGFMRDELPVKKDSKIRLFKRSLSAKDKTTTTTTNLSLSSLPFNQMTSSSTSSFSTGNNLGKYRTSDVVEEEEEEDEEGVDDENHFIPLIKQDSVVPLSTSRTIAVSSTDNNINVKPTTTSELASSTSTSSNTKSSMKHAATHSKKLTRLRSFFFKTSSPSSSFSRTQQHQQTSLSSSSSSTRIPRT